MPQQIILITMEIERCLVEILKCHADKIKLLIKADIPIIKASATARMILRYLNF